MDVEALYRAKRSALVRTVMLAGATEEEASDAVQFAFAQLLWERGRGYYRIDNPEAWVRRTAVNDFRSATPRITSRRRKVIETASPPYELPEPTSAAASAADAAELNEELRLAQHEMAQLPGKQHRVMVAHFLGLSHEEIAELLGMHPDAVRQNLSRARKTLRKRRGMTQGGAS